MSIRNLQNAENIRSYTAADLVENEAVQKIVNDGSCYATAKSFFKSMDYFFTTMGQIFKGEVIEEQEFQDQISGTRIRCTTHITSQSSFFEKMQELGNFVTSYFSKQDKPPEEYVNLVNKSELNLTDRV
jgi:activator of 2-hydroxyglutaryl-CoA dehydratase